MYPQMEMFSIVLQRNDGSPRTNGKMYVWCATVDRPELGEYLQKDGSLSTSCSDGWFENFAEVAIAFARLKDED